MSTGCRPGLGDDDQRERDRAERERRIRPGAGTGGAADHPHEIGRARDERRDGEREHQRGLDEDRNRQIAARAHQRKPVRDLPGRGGDGEPCQGEQSGEHERVPADAEIGHVGGQRHHQHGRRDARRGDRRREPVDEPGSLHVHGALAPQPTEVTVGLQRRRAPPALKARLPVLHQPRQERSEGDPAHHLGDRRRGRRTAHPITPSFAAARTTSTSAIR